MPRAEIIFGVLLALSPAVSIVFAFAVFGPFTQDCREEYVKECVSFYEQSIEGYPMSSAFEVCEDAYDAGFRDAFPIMQHREVK